MKKNVLLLPFILISIIGCNNNVNNNSNTDETSSVFSVLPQSDEISSSESKIEELSSNSTPIEESSSDNINYETLVKLPDIEIEVGERYYFRGYFDKFDDVKITSNDDNIVSYSERYLIGNNIGKTNVVIEADGKYQKVEINVYENGYFSDSFAFDRAHFYGKYFAAFGDSVTAQATIGYGNKTYLELVAKKYGGDVYSNYAIGGTTATYMYPGSNIYKEYKNNTTAIDGCRVVYNAYRNDEIADIDYAFIAFGHNDQYFQPPISVEGDDAYCVDGSFSTCHSFKGSYRYMINVLRHANPNIRIILLNCTYSKYGSGYGGKLTYNDYRTAIKEIAIETKCRYIDPWDFLMPYYDNGNGNTYYKDTVHLTPKGHQLLANYILNN